MNGNEQKDELITWEESILFWPYTSSSSASSSPLHENMMSETGYIFGWDETILEKRSSRKTVRKRTTICAFVIPIKYFQQQQKEHGNDYDLESYLKESLNGFISNSCSSDRSSFDHNHLLGSFSLIAIWEPDATIISSTGSSNNNKHQSSSSTSTLPTIVPYTDGPSWQSSFCNAPSLDNCHQVVLYETGKDYRLGTTKSTDNKNKKLDFRSCLNMISNSALIEKHYLRHLTTFRNSNASKLPSCEENNNRQNNGNNSKSSNLNITTNNVHNGNNEESTSFLSKYSLTYINLKNLIIQRQEEKEEEQQDHPLVYPPLLYMMANCIGKRKANNDNYLARTKVTSIILDLFLGALFGLYLLYLERENNLKKENIFLSLLHFLCNGHQQILLDYTQWLEAFPIGFKLNVPLTKHIGKEINTILRIHESILSSIISSSEYHYLIHRALYNTLIVISFTCGITTILSIFFDLLRLVSIHITAISFTFRKLYQFHTSTFYSLVLFFSGKKVNPLRAGRIDTLPSYDYMQLLLGTLLFTITLFLTTTFFVYYFFFHGIVQFCVRDGILVVIWVLVEVIKYFPMYQIWLYYCQNTKQADEEDSSRKGFCFVKDVYLTHFEKKNVIMRNNHPIFYNDGNQKKDTRNTGRNKNIVYRCDILTRVKKPISSVLLVAYNGKPINGLLSNIPSFVMEIVKGAKSTTIEKCLTLSRVK